MQMVVQWGLGESGEPCALRGHGGQCRYDNSELYRVNLLFEVRTTLMPMHPVLV